MINNQMVVFVQKFKKNRSTDSFASIRKWMVLDQEIKHVGWSLLKMSLVFHRYSGKSKVEDPFCTDFMQILEFFHFFRWIPVKIRG